MNDNTDMEAPQISTLRDEETPPPAPNPTRGKFRVNLLVGEKKSGGGSPSGSSSRKQLAPRAASEDDEDEEHDELEEDQLIDDDDEGIQVKKPLSVTVPPLSGKAKPPPKKRARKTDKQDSKTATPNIEGADLPSVLDSVSAKALPKKKAAPKKPAAPKAGPKAKAAKPTKSLALPHLEDSGALSEAYTGTAASSPAQHEANSPEPDAMSVAPPPSDVNLDSVVLPVYPLPSKPFPVQPPPKIATGFAPVIPLDKSKNKPRRWRTANREIRGIAGGRWFARTWVGDKESDVANATANSAAAAAVLKANMESDKRAVQSPSGPLPTPSAPVYSPSASKTMPKPVRLPATPSTSVGPSRAASIVSESGGPHAPRPPTKMRNMLAADASSDVEMAPPQ